MKLLGKIDHTEEASNAPSTISDLLEDAERLTAKAMSANTRQAYSSDWKMFRHFCALKKLTPLPASTDTVAAYVTWMTTIVKRKFATITRHMTSISRIHQLNGHPSPTKDPKIESLLSGVVREIGRFPTKASVINWELLCKLVDTCESNLMGLRDAALLMIGWCGALRASELVALRFQDVTFCEEGLKLYISRSKTDQEAEGYYLYFPSNPDSKYCPVYRLKRWVERTKHARGILFFWLGRGGDRWYSSRTRQKAVSTRTISNIIKQRIYLLKMDYTDYSSHSLRRGLATEAGRAGVPERIISRHTRHHSIAVLRGYIDDGNGFEENPLPAIWYKSLNRKPSSSQEPDSPPEGSRDLPDQAE